ncbi:MAG: HK97 gp10 family phage protein [Corynebacterium sp.]|nr:HK97 gp10 family phage protein [Corynebacterium sp.]
MAKTSIKMPTKTLEAFAHLTTAMPDIADEAVTAGGRVVESKVRANLTAAIGNTKGKSRSTGQLLGALGLSPAKVDRKGDHNVKVGFTENRRDGRPNALIANVLEYGKAGQAPRPFLSPARASSRRACLEAMKQVLQNRMKGR